jgi:hypothetical protein
MRRASDVHNLLPTAKSLVCGRYNQAQPLMGIAVSDRSIQWFRITCAAVLLAGATCYIAFTIHWQWMWDTSVMHYIVLSLQHGKVPYRDIYDINMPGSYLTERWALAVFGSSDLGWRLYEYSLLSAMTAAMMVIARPWDWLAGLFAGVLFAVQLGSYGPYQAAERDEVMTVLIFIGIAFLFTAVRRQIPWLALVFGLSTGIAILIKPTVFPFALLLLAFVFFAAKHRGLPPTPYLLYGVGGLAIALAILLSFILPHHALSSFLFILSKLVPYYSGLAHPTFGVLLRRSLPAAFLVYLPLALLLAFTHARRAANWEIWTIRAGILFGGASYFVQGKGYDYHRIAFVCFGLLWAGLEFTQALKDPGWRRVVGVLGLAFGALFMVPFNARKIRMQHETNQAAFILKADLEQLGGPQLQGRVQCFDMVGGCLSALYRLGLVQSTGFDGDTQFFGPDDGKVVPYYRTMLLNQLRAAPPAVIIVSNEWYQSSTYSFEKLNTWPAFREFLESNYRLEATHGPFDFHGSMSFRVYVLRQYPRHLDPA